MITPPRKSKRKILDFYPTPCRLTEELLLRVKLSGTIVECCSGDNAIAKILRSITDCKVITCDIDPQHQPDFQLDMTKEHNWLYLTSQVKPDWIVTNPPFLTAPQMLPLAWKHCRKGMAVLLRLTYLEPAGNRAEWLQRNRRSLSNLIIFGQPRPSFTENCKTDSVTTAWMVWRKDITDNTEIDFAVKWTDPQ